MNPLNGDAEAPTPEQLAAYADGELDGHPGILALKGRIEAWLARHPEARAEIEAQQRLCRLWHQTRPSEPALEVWCRIFPHLERSLDSGAQAHPSTSPWRPFGWIAGTLAASAAAVLLAIALLDRPEQRHVDRQDAPQEQQPRDLLAAEFGAVFPVTAEEDVEFLSISGPAVVRPAVGQLPIRGPIPLVGTDEIQVVRCNSELRIEEGGTPIIWEYPAQNKDKKP